VNVCFEPHSDDAALFAAFTTMEHHAHVVTVLESHVQAARGTGITQQQRVGENAAAMRELGLTFDQWPYRDDRPDWPAVEVAMRAIDDRLKPETVLAPMVELGAHEQHIQVGHLAEKVFGGRIVFYMTYVRGHGRTVTERPVVGTPDQVARKLRALACYRSQIGEPSCRSWFLDGLTEYLA
jgi:LmbE family N-acetylglucosaminyl deacetylase